MPIGGVSREDHSSKGHARGPRRAAHVNAGNHWSTGEHRHDWKIARQGGVGNGYGFGNRQGDCRTIHCRRCQSCRSRHLRQSDCGRRKTGPELHPCSGRRVQIRGRASDARRRGVQVRRPARAMQQRGYRRPHGAGRRISGGRMGQSDRYQPAQRLSGHALRNSADAEKRRRFDRQYRVNGGDGGLP